MIDNLVVATVVEADGRIVKASDNENPDLFWGIRGTLSPDFFFFKFWSLSRNSSFVFILIKANILADSWSLPRIKLRKSLLHSTSFGKTLNPIVHATSQ